MEELFLSILNMSLTASYVIFFIIILRLLLKKAPKAISYGLWSVAAFRLVCPISFKSMLSLLPKNTSPIPPDIAYQTVPQINSGIESIDSIVSRALPAVSVEAGGNPLLLYTQIGAYIWITGIAAMLAYSVVSVFILKKRLENARLAEYNIYEAEYLKTPFVLGFIRPRIYIPSGLSTEERRYILLHEQTHIRRCDHLIKLFSFFVLSVHWFNPLVWLAFMLMSTDMELSCDESVIRRLGGEIKKHYAVSLLSLASGKRIINGSPLAFGEGNVKSRIKNVLNYKKPALWIVIAAVIASVGIGIGLAANPEYKGPGRNDEASVKNYIQVEITKPGSRTITGRVITDKDGYKAGDIVSIAITETVTYDIATLEIGDWIDVGYYTVREKYPPEFAAYDLSTITGNYPSTFTLFEGGEVIRLNTLRNAKVSTELPSLILSGSPDSQPSINDVPAAARYLKIDIGSGGDKIYYTYENYGKCYIEKPYGGIYEISRDTFDKLMEYVYKDEITQQAGSRQTVLEPTAPDLSSGQAVSVDMVELDYASDDIVIFHDYFGLFVYDLNGLQIIRSLDLKPLNCHQTQGDNYCQVYVSPDGNTVQLHPLSSENMYVYMVSNHTLQETAYQPMEDRFGSFVPIEDVIDSSKLGNYSHTAVRFDTGEYGFLHTTHQTLGTLSYIRGDMMYRLFDIKEK